MFLTPADVRRLTGKCHRRAQIAVLQARGYAFELDGGGWPLVLVHSVEQKFGQARTAAAERAGPDPAALAALMHRE